MERHVVIRYIYYTDGDAAQTHFRERAVILDKLELYIVVLYKPNQRNCEKKLNSLKCSHPQILPSRLKPITHHEPDATAMFHQRERGCKYNTRKRIGRYWLASIVARTKRANKRAANKLWMSSTNPRHRHARRHTLHLRYGMLNVWRLVVTPVTPGTPGE